VFDGVLEKFPRLKLGFMEAGCSWVPYWMGRMDEKWEKRGKVDAPLCKQKPSVYIKSERLFFHAEDYEPLIGATAEVISPKILFFASDWPHWDNEYPENIDHLKKRKDLSPELKKWIFAGAAKRLFNLNRN
jgi:predicted TIM-barrel fold metal-dependent hydrolase